MTTATFIRPDTHLFFLAGEVAFTKSLGEQEQDTLFNWLAQWAVWHVLINVSTLDGTYVSGIHPLTAPIHRSTRFLLIWKWSYEIQNERGKMKNLTKIQWNKHISKRQHPHPTHASLISQFFLMWLVPNECRALYMTHMLSTWLYDYLNWGDSHRYTVHTLKSP